jgi:Cof subfamily protein (haloacid dehalogenase superfamily)
MDETFLARDHSIPAENLRAVRSMETNGIEFVPASGRGFDSIMMTLAPLVDAGLVPEYVISYNGGCITHVPDEEVVYSRTMPLELAEEAFELSRELKMLFHVYVLNGPVWLHDMNESERRFLEGRMLVSEFEGNDLGFLKGQPIAKCLIQSDDFERLHEVGDTLDELGHGRLASETEVVYSSDRYIEFCPKGVDKGSGLARLADLLDIPMDETIGCGDSFNDLTLIQDAGLGVGTAGVTPDVRPSCDYVCAADCDEGIMGEVFERFLAPDHPRA